MVKTKSSSRINLIMYKTTLFTLLTLIFINSIFAGKIDKGFKALNEKNYPKAKEYFEDVLKDNNNHPGAQLGMARYYSAADNTAFDISKAYDHIAIADANYKTAPNNIRKEITDAGLNDNDFENTKIAICKSGFDRAVSQNTIEAYDFYINQFKLCEQNADAVNRRNQLAFKAAQALNTAEAYKGFIEKYPNAKENDEALKNYDERLYQEKTNNDNPDSYKTFYEQYPKSAFAANARVKFDDLTYAKYVKEGSIDAIERFIASFPESAHIKEARQLQDKLLFETKTKDKTLESYILFINQYPSSPYKNNAEEQVFLLATKGEKNIKNYLDFIAAYPTNPFIKSAWNMIYNMEINYNDTASFSRFLGKYKNYPDQKGVEKLIAQYRKNLYCIKGKNGKWGYMDESGHIYIPCLYEKAFNFNDGMALVQKDGKYGYINKGNAEVVKCVYEFAYDFKGQYARVKGNSKYGIINRNGDTIVPVIYEDILDFNKEGLARVKKNNKYGFVDLKNRLVIDTRYDEVKDFFEGYSLVRKDETWLYVDKNGAQIYCIE
jgi:outer membrane protein assembly factor BamD (BamD/ComL family)